MNVYQLHVWLGAISPLIWRRLLVRSDSTIADLHHILPIAMGWDDAHLHRFRIRGKDYGLSRIGGLGFRDDPHQVRLCDVHFRPNARFLYEYDFGDLWQHAVRVERRLPGDQTRTYPACIGGKRAAPPEDCGGPWAFIALQNEYSPGYFLDRYADLLESIHTGDLDEARDQLAKLEPLQAWLALEHVDRRQVNRRRTRYALGDEAWRWEWGRWWMKVRIQVIVESDIGETHCVEDVAEFERGALQPETLGLTLAEAKALLQGVQQAMVAEQTTAYLNAQHPCPTCGTPRRCAGHHQLVYRTVFGKLTLSSPRWYLCRCQMTESGLHPNFGPAYWEHVVACALA